MRERLGPDTGTAVGACRRVTLAAFVAFALLAPASGAAVAAPDNASSDPDAQSAPAPSTPPATPASPPASGAAAPAASSPTASSPTSSSPAAPPPAPTIETPIDDQVRLLDTVTALDRPDDDAEPVGRIRAGVRLKAIGIVSGGKWVQIQLPNENTAYVPRAAMAVDANGKPLNEVEKISGTVSSVTNAATLVLGDRTVRLAGIDPGPASVVAPFVEWLKSQGSLDCDPAAGTGAYHCYTSKGVDVGEAAILNGVARVGDGATPVYRERENTAREGKKGLWAQP